MNPWHERVRSTTILGVRRNGQVALGGDGQVTVGQTVMKSNAQKVRTMHGGKLLAGFAGAAADAFTCSRNSRKTTLSRQPSRAAVDRKDWRSDRVLRASRLCRRQGSRLYHLRTDHHRPDDQDSPSASGSASRGAALVRIDRRRVIVSGRSRPRSAFTPTPTSPCWVGR
jgi:hypothetical protein